MMKLIRLTTVAVAGALAAGCANMNVQPKDVICPMMGAAAGTAVAVGATDQRNGGAIAGGAVGGAALAWLACHYLTADEPKPAAPAVPEPAPKPAPAAAAPAPAPKDTDGDGVIDPNDKCPGTPAGVKVDANGCPLAGETLGTLQGVNFDFDKATLRAEAPAILDKWVAALQAAPSIKATVEGNTDSRGSDAYNQKLSEKRAQAVVAYLVSKGVAANRLTAVGRGEGNPVAPNDNDANMAKNRRVDLVAAKN